MQKVIHGGRGEPESGGRNLGFKNVEVSLGKEMCGNRSRMLERIKQGVLK